jgi:hypothetical protein
VTKESVVDRVAPLTVVRDAPKRERKDKSA